MTNLAHEKSTLKEIPPFAFGVGTKWLAKPSSDLITAVKTAINLGYTHIDTSEIYANEIKVAIAIKESKVPRQNIFLTSKVYPNISNVKVAFHQTLDNLNTDYLDMYLIHAPFGVDVRMAWLELEKLVDLGFIKYIGVSNFRVKDLEYLLSFARIKPKINQIEFHAYLQSPTLHAYCLKNQIQLSAYAPLSPTNGRIRGGPLDGLLEDLAQKYSKTKAQVLLSWVRQNGVFVVTTTGSHERMVEGLDVSSFCFLEDGDLRGVGEVGRRLVKRLYWLACCFELDGFEN